MPKENLSMVSPLRTKGHSVHKGDLFILGNHRLLCGDSQNPSNMKALIEYRLIHFIFAGPPYFNQRSYSYWETYTAYLQSMSGIVGNSMLGLKKGGAFAMQIGRGSTEHKDHAAHLSVLMDKHGLQFQDAIAWIKPGANYSVKRSCHIRSHGFYYPAFQWEVVLVYRLLGPMPRMSPKDRKIMAQHHTDVWNIPWLPQQMKRIGHPAVSPTEIPRRCILAYAPKGGHVLDPFGGSGTTLIAAEQTNRHCLLMERRPEYCRLIIQRWEDLTGKKARRK